MTRWAWFGDSRPSVARRAASVHLACRAFRPQIFNRRSAVFVYGLFKIDDAPHRAEWLRSAWRVKMVASSQSRFGPVKVALAAVMMLAVAACASPFKANVSRFQSQLPAPQGQTFAVVAEDPAMAGGIEFAQYARVVEAKLAQQGYTPVAEPGQATLVVRFDYGVDTGRERVRSTGFGGDPFWGPWYGYGRFGRGFAGPGMWNYGWYDPWMMGGGFGGGVDSYTIYTSGIEVKIDRRADGQRLFEGKAEAVSTSNRLPYLVPNLVEAMFTDFPGNSGETVRISVAPEKRRS
jgi:hypothetical protein